MPPRSSTKASSAAEANERRLVHLLTTKKKRYEMVYLDVSPERRHTLEAAAGETPPLPALLFGDTYRGDYDAIQELEDDGQLDALLEPTTEGTGFWALPEAWGVQSSMLEGGGVTLINAVPTL